MMLTVLMMLTTFSAVGVSQEEDSFYRWMPPEGRTIVKDGIEYKAFTLDEYKLLAHVLVDYDTLWKLRLNLKLEIKALKDELNLERQRIDNCKEGIENQRLRADMLSKMYDSQYKLQLKRSKLQRFAQAFSWSLVVVESLALGVLGISYALNR